jgi:predicted enzyme related to lactoylglutathione lyase
MTDAGTRGRFVWYDLMTRDQKSAEEFYTGVLGWGTQAWDGMPYTMWTANGTPIGGIMPMPEAAGAPPHWLAYISVPDVDATVDQATSLGARTLVPAKDIPAVGRFAVLADPQGAAFAVFTPLNAAGDEAAAAIGEFSWHELATTDYAKAFAFYEAIFGWHKQAEHDMGPMGIYLLFSRNGRELGGMFTMAPGMQMPPNWLQYVRVDSADAAVERVKSRGGNVLNGPMDVPGGDRIAQCLDPQGAAFAIHSRGTPA